jgi:hypothetical protein
LYLTYPQPYGSELSVDVKCGFWSSEWQCVSVTGQPAEARTE